MLPTSGYFISCFITLTMQLAQAQILQFGGCPDPPAIDLNLERYMGRWFEIERYFLILEADLRCLEVNYFNVSEDGTRFSAHAWGVEGFTNTRLFLKAYDTVRNMSRKGELEVHLEVGQPINFPVNLQLHHPFKVLGTDYDNYVVKWWCTNFGVFHFQNVMVMTRSREPPSEEVQRDINQVFHQHGLPLSRLIKSNWVGCVDEDPNYSPYRRRRNWMTEIRRRWRNFRGFWQV